VVDVNVSPHNLKASQKELTTMGYDDRGPSGIVCVVSRHVGTVAGTSVAISKRVAGCGVKTVATATDWLKRPLNVFVPARYKQDRTISEASAQESTDELETRRKKAAKALIASLESKLSATKRELKKTQSKSDRTESKLTSKLSELKAQKESLYSDLEKAKSETNEASFQEDAAKMRVTALEAHLAAAQCRLEELRKKKKVGAVSTSATEEYESAMEPIAARSDKELKEQPSKGAPDAGTPGSAAVREEEKQAAVFPKATDKIIFKRALSDLASQDATVRADAAQTMACVRHELSVKALVDQMAYESSAQVRQECIKALGTLEMKEAIPIVERALEDEAGSVRLAAVWGLYHLAGTGSLPALVGMFTDESEEVRRRAATCIGWLGQEEFAVELLPLLDDNRASVRRAAAEAMGNLCSRKVVSSLIEQLNDPVDSVRKAVFSALQKITGRKMSKSFPRDKKGLKRLIARWQEWQKEELLG
jgi:HEAT repeat protein